MFAACGAAGPGGYAILDKVRTEMERRDIPLNTITSNALMSALALCGKDQDAIQVGRERGWQKLGVGLTEN